MVATLRLLLFAIRTTRRNIVVAPGGALRISSVVFQVLLCLLLSVVAPGVSELIPQPAFSLLYAPDDGAVVGAAPTGEYGSGARQGQLLAAVTHQGNGRRVPLIGSAKGGFVDLVVPPSARTVIRVIHLLLSAA
jgi:hypothetical protein